MFSPPTPAAPAPPPNPVSYANASAQMAGIRERRAGKAAFGSTILGGGWNNNQNSIPGSPGLQPGKTLLGS